MEDCREDTAALVLTGVIILIAAIFSALILQAYAWWRVSRRENAWIKVILMLSLIIVILTCVFSFGAFIPLKFLFALSLLSQYLMLFSMTILVTYLRHEQAPAMRQRLRWFLLPLHALYIFCFVIGLTQAGATCKQNVGPALPLVFYVKDGLHLVTFLVLLFLKQNKFYIDWRKDTSQSQVNNQSLEQQMDDKNRAPAKIQQQVEKIGPSSEEETFKFRTSRLVYYGSWCMFVSMMSTMVTVMLTSFSEHISCNAQSQWDFQSCSAALFIDTLARLAILNSCFLTRMVFIKTQAQMQMQWAESFKNLGSDYKRGLSPCNPETFSDEESDEKTIQMASSQHKSSLTTKRNGRSQSSSREGKISIIEGTNQTHMETQAGLGDDEQNLPTERCDTEDNLLVGHQFQTSRDNNTQKKNSELRILKPEQFLSADKQGLTIIQEEDRRAESSQKSPSGQKKYRSINEIKGIQSHDPKRNIQLRAKPREEKKIVVEPLQNTSSAMEQGIEPRQSSSQNGSEKFTPQSTANKYYEDHPRGGQISAEEIQLQFDNNNQRQNRNLNSAHPFQMQASGETGQSEELFMGIGFHDDDVPLRAGESQKIQDQIAAERRSRYNQSRHNQSQSEEASRISPPIMANKIQRTGTDEYIRATATFQEQEQPKPEVMRGSLISSLTILPDDIATVEAHRNQLYRPSEPAQYQRNRDKLVNDDTLSECQANQTEQPIYKESHEPRRRRSSEYNKMSFNYANQDINSEKKQRNLHRETFGYAPMEIARKLTESRDKEENRHCQPEIFEVAPTNMKPKLVGLTAQTPSPMKEDMQTEQEGKHDFGDDGPQKTEGSDWLSKKEHSDDEDNIYQNTPILDSQQVIRIQSITVNPMLQSHKTSVVNGNSSNQEDEVQGCDQSKKSTELQKAINETTPSSQLNMPQQYMENNEQSQNTIISPISKAQSSMMTPTNIGYPETQEQFDDKGIAEQNHDNLAHEVDEKNPKKNRGKLQINVQLRLLPIDEKDNKLGGKYSKWQDEKQRQDCLTTRQRNMRLKCEVYLIKEEIKEVRVANIDDKNNVEESKNYSNNMLKRMQTPGFKDKENDKHEKEFSDKEVDVFYQGSDDENYRQNQPNLIKTGNLGNRQESERVMQLRHAETSPIANYKKGSMVLAHHQMTNHQEGDKLDLPTKNIPVVKKQRSDPRSREKDRRRNASFLQYNEDPGLNDDMRYEIPDQGLFQNEYIDSHSMIDGPGGGRTHSFISGIPNEVQQFVTNHGSSKMKYEAPQSPFTPTSTKFSPDKGPTRNLLAGVQIVKRKRVVRSHMHARVVNMAIVPKLTAYKKNQITQKLDSRMRLVQQQHGIVSEKRLTEVMEESKEGSVMTPIQMLHQTEKSRKQAKTYKKTVIDFRQPSPNDNQTVQGRTQLNVYHEARQENRFVKNILKKSGQGRQVGMQSSRQTKKHVQFKIGTGTRGQAHRDEIPLNYNGSLDTSSQRSYHTELSSQAVETVRQISNIQMAMPGGHNKQADLNRRVEMGPEQGSADLRRQMILLQKQRDHRAKYNKPYAPKVQQQKQGAKFLPLPAGSTNPFLENEQQKELSPNEYLLKTAQDLNLISPYDQKQKQAPSPRITQE